MLQSYIFIYNIYYYTIKFQIKINYKASKSIVYNNKLILKLTKINTEFG
jgi:hypothetical protein